MSERYDIHLLEKFLRGEGAGGWQVKTNGYFYAETGRWKPWSVATIKAAQRRGYKVEAHCHGTVFYVYPKTKQYDGLLEGL